MYPNNRQPPPQHHQAPLMGHPSSLGSHPPPQHHHNTPAPEFLGNVRVAEFLEQIKKDYATMEHEHTVCKLQRDELERKLEGQINEFHNMQQAIMDLELNYQSMKQTYEERIQQLTHQLEQYKQQQQVPLGEQVPQQPNNPINIPPPSNIMPPMHHSSPTLNSSTLPPMQSMQPPTLNPPVRTSTPTIPLQQQETTKNGPTPNNRVSPSPFPPITSVNDGMLMQPNINTPPTHGYLNNLSPIVSNNVSQQQQPNQLTPSSENRIKHINNVPPPNPTIPANNTMNQQQQPTSNNGNSQQVDLFSRGNGDQVVKIEGNDWVVVYNPQVTSKPSLNMNLYHNLEQDSVVCCVRFSNCGKYLATGSNKQAIVFDVDSGKKVGIFSTVSGKEEQDEDKNHMEGDDQDSSIIPKEDSYIRSVCFSPDSKYLVAGAEDKTIKIWDLDTKQIYRSLEGHELDIYSLDFSPDNRYLVSGSGDGKAKIWDIGTGECKHTCGNEEIGPREGVTSVAISPDGRVVATGSLDCIVRLWDMHTGELLEAFSGHDDSVYSVAFAPDGKTLASGSLDRTLKIWDIKSNSCVASLSGHRDFVLSVAYSPDGKWLVSGSKDRSVQFWDPRSNVLHLMLQGHKNSVISVALNPKRPLFATGSGDFRARVWSYGY